MTRPRRPFPDPIRAELAEAMGNLTRDRPPSVLIVATCGACGSSDLVPAGTCKVCLNCGESDGC